MALTLREAVRVMRHAREAGNYDLFLTTLQMWRITRECPEDDATIKAEDRLKILNRECIRRGFGWLEHSDV